MSQTHDFGMQSTAEAVRAVGQAAAASDFRRASELSEVALAKGLIHPAFMNARAIWFQGQGREEDALTAFQQARALAPQDPAILNAIGLCLTRLFRLDEALAAFDEAIRIAPAYAATHQRRGVVLGLSGQTEAAERAYRRAVQLQPDNVAALASLAAIFARRGDAKLAQEYAARTLRIDRINATALAALAVVDLSQDDFAAAERHLSPVIDDPTLVGHGRAVVFGLLGDAYDGQDFTEKAISAYTISNDEHRKLHAARFRGKPSATELVERLTEDFGAAIAEPWPVSEQGTHDEQDARQHVFLLGFHRSGTTLLEQALESHPDIVTLEERDFLAEPAERYLTTASGLSRLSNLEGAPLAMARAAYWRGIENHGIAVRNKVFVDKHPFNTVKLPLIYKLFPGAKVVFALRDPRDVVLSCFRRQFDVDPVKYEFLTLEGAARLYDRVMRFAALCRENLPLDIHPLRYEDLVADFDGTTRSVCDFVGVPWNDAMRDFAATAKRQDIRSPSADQVTRGLYTEGVGQWRRYRAQLAPVFSLLQPWIETFGYPPD